MEQVLLVVQVIVTIGLIGMVLLQRSESDGFGLGSGSGANLLSGRSSANLMTRTTAILATLFILNSLALSVLAAHNKPASIVDAIKAEESSAPAVPATDAKANLKKETAPAAKAAKPVVPTAGDAAPAEAETSAEDAPKPVKKIIKKVEPVEAPSSEE